MRIDFLKSGAIDRSGASTVQYQMVRGRLSGLLLINSTTWHYKDKITIKLRHEGGLLTVVDRVSALVLATLCDLKKGMPTTGTPDYVGDQNGDNNDNGGYVRINAGVQFYENAFELPLGHITLTGAQQLEITVETAPQTAGGAGVVSIYSVADKARTDVILNYDVSQDLEAQQSQVREIYLLGKNNVSFFTSSPNSSYGLPVAADITIRLGVDGDDSEASLEALSAMTAIRGELTFMPNSLIRCYQDFESLPANVYVKVFGDDSAGSQILYVRETQVPHMVAASIVAAVDKEQRRVEVLEQNEPEKARALIQSGAIASSEKLAAAKDSFVPAVATPAK